jgi:hypothetical protein
VPVSRAGRAADLATLLLNQVDDMSEEQVRLAMRGEGQR